MAQTNLIGKTVLGYTVSEKIGFGAFGTVYKVVKTNAAGHYVRALKHITIPTEKQYNSVLNSMGGDVSKADNYFSEMLKNIVAEINILNDLSEKGVQNIVRYYENDITVSESPKRYDIYILMEYMTPLDDYITDHVFCVRDVMKLGLDVLHGLKSCHNNGVIHRDIKDDNIFVSDNGDFKIGDFGVSKVLKDSSKAESLKGTPNYLAPEVYLGKEGYTKSVDLYSLGIVLYRLLNYNRNPFLPRFPDQYFAQDEDNAFEERMSGKIPDLPALGGKEIGNVIVKAISNRMERYQTAEEFLDSLKNAISLTPADEFEKSIKIGANVSNDIEKSHEERKYCATIGEVTPEYVTQELNEDERNSTHNKHLFESIGETPNLDVPQSELVHHDNKNQYEEKSNPQTQKTNKNTELISPIMEEAKEPDVIDKKVMQRIVFLIPVLLIIVGVVAYFIVIPKIYGKVVSFIDWLFTDPQNIINTVHDSNSVLPHINSILGVRIFWWTWLTCFISSLFAVGKLLQEKPEPNAVNAIFTKREPYLKIQDVIACLKLVKVHKGSQQLDSLIYSVKKLEEKLSIESDFGYGGKAVIACENNIALQIQFLVDTASCIENGDYDETIKAMNTAVMNINSLLRKRTELKKR